jgi:hypothetical protein
VQCLLSCLSLIDKATDTHKGCTIMNALTFATVVELAASSEIAALPTEALCNVSPSEGTFASLESYKASTVRAFALRVAYEKRKATIDAFYDFMRDHVVRNTLHDRVLATMLTAKVDPFFINRRERSNACYNIKSAEKVSAIARYINSAGRCDPYTLPIFQTAYNIEAHTDSVMTTKDAQSACSLSFKVSDSKREKLICKYAKHQAQGTISTQSSSSLNALQMYHILIEGRNEANETTYCINRDSLAAHALASLLGLSL